MKTAMFVVGTRPEIIKVAPVIAELRRRNLNYVVVSSGQHWDDLMFARIIADVGMARPDVDLELDHKGNIEQIGLGLLGLEAEIYRVSPDIVVANGDTNTVLAACLVANKMLVPFAHIESGLRSFDWRMMEEQNRVLVDHASQWLFAPTRIAVENLASEGISNSVYLVGNTVADALLSASAWINKIRVPSGDYCLATLHRRENINYPDRVVQQLRALNEINRRLPVIFPVHPRTQKLAEEYCDFATYPPMGYIEFLAHQKNAKVIVTDSGGVQEEASIFGVPCVTLRDNTERPETIEAGVNRLVPADEKKIIEAVMDSMETEIAPLNLYGDGNAAAKIVDVLGDAWLAC